LREGERDTLRDCILDALRGAPIIQRNPIRHPWPSPELPSPTDADAKGFPGLIASYDADNKTVDAGGAAAKTSVWFVKFGERDVQFVLGENSVLQMSPWRVESLDDDNGKKFPGYVADLTTWIGLQFVNKHSAVRIKNIGTADGTTMNDNLAFEALTKFPADVTPNYYFMNRRTLEQLRRSRTHVTSPTGVPTLPDNVGGIPIVITDSIVNTEA
ncbi:MAG: major capsid protein, partial [Verrucomicrobiota bacterium]